MVKTMQIIQAYGNMLKNTTMTARAAAGQMGALSRIVFLCPFLKYYGSKKKNYYRGQNRTLIKYKSK